MNSGSGAGMTGAGERRLRGRAWDEVFEEDDLMGNAESACPLASYFVLENA